MRSRMRVDSGTSSVTTAVCGRSYACRRTGRSSACSSIHALAEGQWQHPSGNGAVEADRGAPGL
eukprot:2009734-Pyramimonas_sp.AAC.1